METPNFDHRRHARLSLIADLTLVFTIALSTFAWAQVNPPAAERTTTLSSAPAAAASYVPASEPSNDDVGCGCAEACLVAR